MTELLTAAQMRAIEQAAIDRGQVTGLELMERAGAGVVAAVFKEWPALTKTDHRAVVLCGPGNNGGDGFVVARLLHEWGWQVEVFLYGDEARLPPDAKVNCIRWRQMGAVQPFHQAPKLSDGADLFVDGLFGTGLKRPLTGGLYDWVTDRAADPAAALKTVAIDMPSGLCSDSGRELAKNSETMLAALTVSFHREKPGHHLKGGAFKCGKVVVVDIGLGSSKSGGEVARLLDQRPKHLGKADLAHKYSHGHAYVLSGASPKTGAARLAARGALRIGAGVVTVACPPDAVAEHAAQLTAIMLTAVADAQALSAVLEDTRINAICVGPALGLTQDNADILAAVLQVKRATVVDADGLTLISQDKALFDLLHDKCILTPHGGEFQRLFPDIAEKLAATPTKGPAYSKVDATREAAKRAGCVVLFKGGDTVIADAQGRCVINSAHYERAAPWLATAGSGDVLAGFITGLLARGFDPMQAAEMAAWLHVACALEFGPGLIAEDLPECLPQVFRKLGL
ncbi:MAG: NAD(P)H-hydrate dehydratase [Rhodobacterales bacterium]